MCFEQQLTFLYTSDLEKTSHFYENLIGLDLVLDQGACRIYRVSGDAFLGICTKAGTKPATDGVIFTFVTFDVDGWYAQLREKGVVFEKPPQINEAYNIYHCFLHDPNGYLLEIQRFLDPRWPGE